MSRRLVLITGASAGIGEEFARQYAARGWDVALTARRAERLDLLAREVEETYGVSAQTIVQDLARAGAADAIISEIASAGRDVDGLVNNAGYGLPGTFFNTSWEDQAAFLQVLLNVPLELTHKLLPGMAARGFGRIINVASLAGFTPGSNGHTLYGPVKSALIKFSESIQAEADAAGHDINCTALCPGFTFSEFHDVNGTRSQTEDMPKWLWMDAAPVVEAGIEAVGRGQPVVVPGGVNKGLATAARLMPDPIARSLMRQQSKRFRKTDV